MPGMGGMSRTGRGRGRARAEIAVVRVLEKRLGAGGAEAGAVVGGVGAAAVREFGVGVGRLHWGMTSVSVYGAYPDPEGEFPGARGGHPKDRRPDLKQIQAGLAVSGDGGIPV